MQQMQKTQWRCLVLQALPYPIMASLDLCMQWAETKGKNAYLQLQKRVVDIKKIAAAKGIAVPLGETDPVRITLQTASLGGLREKRLPKFSELTL